MLTAYERHLLAVYLSNVASSLHHRDEEASTLAKWVAERESRSELAGTRTRSRRRRPESNADEGMSARRLRHLQEALENERAMTQARCDRTGRRLRRLAKTIGLSRTDVGILEFLLRYWTQPIIKSMVDAVFARARQNFRIYNLRGPALPALLGISMGTVHRRFATGAPLVRSGLVSVDDDGDLIMVGRLERIATVPGDTSLDAHRLLFPPVPPSDLEWSDFDHIAPDRDHVERLLAGALDAGVPGVNILLHGPPGTGKTELCKVLADRLGVTLFAVGEADDDGDEPARRERLQELRLAQRLLAGDRGALLLFDEMEDLLSDPLPSFAFLGGSSRSHSREGKSKVFMHRLLEQAPAPTLWTMNDAEGVSRAILRRMMFALELRSPSPRVRARIWTRQLKRHGIEAQPHEAQALASEFEATPGVAAGATAAARLGGGGIETVRRGVRSLSRVLSGERPPRPTPARFDPALVRADVDPLALAGQLARSGERRFSLCLQGPPGTGKSALVRYLAERLGLEVAQKRASDLMSMWVGETEQRIAAAFAEARDADAFLVFDEADSLLADRRLARAGWEVSQVNEMLTWMESHPLPFACTTNFGEHLDPATLRRFVFKIRLDHLTPAQAETAFRNWFALAPPAGLAALTTLTPGDFAVVHRKAEILDRLHEPEALVAMLREECDSKPDRPRAIGFRP